MQRSRATERDQSVIARVVASLHADHADCARHVGRDHGDDALRCSQRIHAQHRCQAVYCCFREIPAHLHTSSQEMRRVQGLQDHIGIGDRRLVVAAVVAGWPGIGTGAARPDFEQSARVDKRDRAATGADGMNIEHRRLDRIAVDDRLPSEPCLAALQQGDIGGGASHVERDDVVRTGKARRHLGTDHSGARARQDRPHRQLRRDVEPDHTTVGLRQIWCRSDPEGY